MKNGSSFYSASPAMQTPPALWVPNPMQELLLQCPVFELLAWGNRGGGKSDWLLMEFLKGVDKGFGPEWRGFIMRREEKDLVDMIARADRWFRKAFPSARYRSESRDWTFPNGERLVFLHAKRNEDIRGFLGQEWPYQAYDELCNWPEPDLYLDIQSCARSPNKLIRPRIRASTNPWGPGAHWVSDRFINAVAPAKVFRDLRLGADGAVHEVTRTHVRVDFSDNEVLKAADPGYIARLSPSDLAKKAAWVDGIWDLSVGGFFSGIWDVEAHVVEPFIVPVSWRIDRAHDWGASKPHCTLWFAESDGSPVEIAPGVTFKFPKGTLFVIDELYGWNGEPNCGRRDSDENIAADIRKQDQAVSSMHGGARVASGPADTQIFDAPQGKSISDTYHRHNVYFDRADKSQGSRITGAKAVIDRLSATSPFAEGRPMEEKGLLVFSTCKHVIRTLPKLQRDERQPDDVDSDGEDHCYDVIRYRCLAQRRTVMVGRF